MPSHPDLTYKNKGWVNWGEFLGTGRAKTKIFASYEAVKKRVQNAGIKSKIEYQEWQKTQEDAPSQPEKIYKGKGWVNWGEFLGKDKTRAKIFVSYEEARWRTHQAGILSSKTYEQWQKNQEDMPSHPDLTYKNKGWVNWGEFLGTNRSKAKNFVSYEEAKWRTHQGWHSSPPKYTSNVQKNQEDMPSHPNLTYKNKGWVNWGEFLGHKQIKGQNLCLL